MQSGAGGNWPRFGETKDGRIIKQTTGVSCMSAVGEMLLKGRGISVGQDKILDIIKEPCDVATLAAALNGFDQADDGLSWLGSYVDGLHDLRIVFKKEETAVILRDAPSTIGHAVILAELGEDYVTVLDPYDQTCYRMHLKDFDECWGLEVVVRWFRS